MDMQAATTTATVRGGPGRAAADVGGEQTKVKVNASVLPLEGINRRGTAAAVFPLTLHVYSAKYCNTCARSD